MPALPRTARSAMTPPTTPEHPVPSATPFYDPFAQNGFSPVAQKIEACHQDVLEGGPADTTLTFALDGRDYEVDLSATDAEWLREALRPFVSAAREAPTGNGPRKRPTGGTGGDAAEAAAIRAWAKKYGHQISARGRIPAEIRQAYHAAAGGQPSTGSLAPTDPSLHP